MEPKCIICHIESQFLLNKDEFDLYKCHKCQLVFVYPQPPSEFLQKKLYSLESGYMSNRARQDLSADIEQPRVEEIFNYFQKKKRGGVMLDVGCGNGQMIYWAKKRGINGAGVELNERTANRAREYGFEVYVGFLKDAPYEKNSFDFIFLGEIIEHVTNPREFIRECDAFLKPGGYIAITTPNIDCAWSKMTFKLYKWFGIPWSSVTPPYHLFQFGPDNLNLLMREEGFSAEYEKFLRIPPLKYELGMLHLMRRYKNRGRKISDLLFAGFSYVVYLIVHTLFKLVHPFLQKDFQMVKVYKNVTHENIISYK